MSEKEYLIYKKQQTVSLSQNRWKVVFNDQARPDRLLVQKQAASSDFYGKFYESGAATKALEKVRHWQHEHILSKLGNLKADKNIKVLDIGCGTGKWVEYLRDQGIEAYGIDPALPLQSSHLRKQGLEQIVAETTSEVSSWPASFDVVTLLDVFEHFEDPNQTLQSLPRLLKPQGTLVIKVPNKDSLLYRLVRGLARIRMSRPLADLALQRLYQVDFPPPHYYYYNYTSLLKILSETGWELESCYYLSEAPVGTIWQRLWNLPLVVKPFVAMALVSYDLFSPRKWKDGMVLHLRYGQIK